MRVLCPLIVVALFAGGCGESSTAATNVGAASAAVAGGWSGTFETTTYSTVPIVMDLTQVGATVTGTWATTGGTLRPFGSVNGTVDLTTFSGTMTFKYTDGPTCSAAFSGPASGVTLNWSSAGFTTGDCGLSDPGNPMTVRLVLQRR